ncbi:MAG: tRNA (adenosine(37)-N6)-threonylcarbamoyltransferase complex transferase subunit TsaD [Deltaproteobacteria bacterium]|nr:tRNA (adenosine(37)-N6)-threonylcarbamoyltransferase complex transferase subunit TsaD [Deltaproteobacteria bacterium]MCX7952620.1 tRNA (adenosine(37)-N6)-threonylcarbamoyltransferase complex transferase subunit TsaD [Deltaproteobacteria bacterium]
MFIFAIETSCDETSWCLAKCENQSFSTISLFNYSQEIHKEYGGVVPELSARQHIEVIKKNRAKIATLFEKADAVAVTEGPGLKGSLLIGANFASGLSIFSNKPCFPVDHVDAHLFSPMLNSRLKFPYLGVVLSGGHTVVCLVNDVSDIKILARTVDDSIGEAFDKCGTLLGLPYPAGSLLAEIADSYSGDLVQFPVGLKHQVNFSFSGFKTAVKRQLAQFKTIDEELQKKLSASIQHALIDAVIEKLELITKQYPSLPIGFSGGVSTNSLLRKKATERFGETMVFFPEKGLCTDNAEIIAFAAWLGICRGAAEPRLPKIYSRWKRFHRS